MGVYKDENTGTWFVKCYYQNYTGARKQKMKRGFKLQREAKEWERNFLEVQQGTPDMTFESLVKLYYADLKGRSKESTIRSHTSSINKHILPFFKGMRVNEIIPANIRRWQRELNETKLSEHSKNTVNRYLNSIFNFAVKYYRLNKSPCATVKKIGKVTHSINFWTLDEFKLFLPTVTDPIIRAAFLVLFYTGIRCGELLALKVKNFDQGNKTLTIKGTFNRFGLVDNITEPKTENSNRTITLPDFLCDELAALIGRIYEPEPDDRIFMTISKYDLYTARDEGIAATGLKYIQIHDLRHSHVSLLINMGFSAFLIAERIGDTVEMVNKVYGHLYPNRHKEVANLLNDMK